jgi:hypothetical protein
LKLLGQTCNRLTVSALDLLALGSEIQFGIVFPFMELLEIGFREKEGESYELKHRLTKPNNM